jgi:flagellar biosynthesis/type III secretory pathway chaperone
MRQLEQERTAGHALQDVVEQKRQLVANLERATVKG